MIYTLQKLQCDVMARLGEFIQSPSPHPELGLPTVDDVIVQKLKRELPLVGKRLIAEASVEELGGGEAFETEIAMCLMPCGLYGAEFILPPDFVRICSVKMRSWTHGVSVIVRPGDSGWERQWSVEPGIAGCKERPQAYMAVDAGIKVLALGSENPADTMEAVYGWRIPEVDDDGSFRFPSALYPALVGSISQSSSSDESCSSGLAMRYS